MAYDEQLAERTRAQLQQYPNMVEKKMFGGIGFLINGNMACGVNGDSLIVRLGVEQYEDASRKPAVRAFDMTGRLMKGWVMVGPAGYQSDEDLRSWIQQGVAFARSLPAK